MDVVSELIGVPEPDRAELRALADLLVHREDGPARRAAAGVEAALTLAGYYADLVAERRRRPARRPDLGAARPPRSTATG